jgi:phosphatidylserine decarboxylase
VNQEVVVDIVERLPQASISRLWGWVVRRKHPRVGVEVLKRVFVAKTGIDMAESADPISAFDCLEDLFVRRLRKGARRIDPDPMAVVSPVDATVGMHGTVNSGTLMQIKGRSYSLSRLLDDSNEAQRFEGGPYATFYLSPRDYHRIHSPLSGTVNESALIPGRLLPVFPAALEKIDELFARNERLVTYVDTPEAGRLAVVKVGATLVGRISVAYDPDLYSNQVGQRRRRIRYDSPRPLAKGGDLGAFELGSTVVLLGEAGRVSFDQLSTGQFTRMGDRIGSVLSQAGAKGRKAPASKKKTSKKTTKKKTTRKKAGGEKADA